MSFWGLPGGRRAFSPRGAADGGAGSGGEHSGGERGGEAGGGRRGGGAHSAGAHGGEARGRRRGAGVCNGQAARRGSRARRAERRGSRARRLARQVARRSLWADAAALHGKARPPAQARAWSGRGARRAAPPAPTLGKKRRMQDYAVFCAACPPARTSYAQRQRPKKQGIVDNVVDNVDKSAARMWKNGLHTRPPRMHFPSPFAFLSRKKSGRPKPQAGYFSF